MINKKLKQKFKEYRQSFKIKELTKKDNKIFFDNEVVEDENGILNTDSEKFINIKYSSKCSINRGLSNLFPYKFKFRGKKVNSIESVLQGIKYKDKKTQKCVLIILGLMLITPVHQTFLIFGETMANFIFGEKK